MPAAKPTSGLAVAVAYWPGRWPRAAVLAALAIEPLVMPMAPQLWVELLDRLETTIAGILVDQTRFP